MAKKKKILIVDDEPIFLEMMKMRLEANNYEVINTLNGKDAIRLVKREKPNAVLLDILMPVVDGLKTLKAIRKIKKDLPVFMVTAFSNKERFELANKFGASGFIVKTSNLNKEVENITRD